MFQCAFCGLRLNEFRLYTKHGDKVHRCYQCSEQFDNTHLLRKHVSGHINQCPLCSRTFESLLVLVDHVNKEQDLFTDKWHLAIGHQCKDDKHKVECEVCHRYLKSFDWNKCRMLTTFFRNVYIKYKYIYIKYIYMKYKNNN